MCEFQQTKTSRLRINPGLGSYGKDVIYNIIDEAPYCHVSASVKDTPYIQPTVHWRNKDKLYIHGAVKNKMIHAIAKGAKAAIAFTHFDGFVLARSAFNHAATYRSVVVFSSGRFINDAAEKKELLPLFINRISPGRWNQIRQPSEIELKKTGIIEFEIAEVSAKILPMDVAKTVFPGGAGEAEEDSNFNPWTGVYPYRLTNESIIHSKDLESIG